MGLSQQALADKAGVALRTVQNWESGTYEPQGNNLHNLCEVLRIPSTYFFDGSEPIESKNYDTLLEGHLSPKGQKCLEYLQRVINSYKSDEDRLSWLYVELTKQFPLPPSSAESGKRSDTLVSEIRSDHSKPAHGDVKSLNLKLPSDLKERAESAAASKNKKSQDSGHHQPS